MRANVRGDAARIVAADAPQQEASVTETQGEEDDVGDGDAVESDAGPRTDSRGEHQYSAICAAVSARFTHMGVRVSFSE